MTSSSKAQSKSSFMSFGLDKNLTRALSDMGFTEPRPIQAKGIPAVMLGRDVLGLAATGTGKTAAFALPILEHLLKNKARGGNGPRVLIVAPTRELVVQIHAEIELLAKYTNVRAMTVFGGVGAGPQIRELRKSPDILVACPGRLLDLANGGSAKLGSVEMLVLDEADHMLDMGFLPDVRRIVKLVPRRRQNLLFSATMPKEILRLTENLLLNPVTVELDHSKPADTIEHALYPVDQPRKFTLLKHILAGDDFHSAIVFLRTKHRAKRLAQDLVKAGHRAIALQGNMSQGARQRAMEGFRNGAYDVLVATDIAARGIDVANVSHVINFDLPGTPDAYTHRIGRTGRSEQSGKACTFVTRDDMSGVKAIERKIKMTIPRVKVRDMMSGGREAALQGRRQIALSRGTPNVYQSERPASSRRERPSKSPSKNFPKGPPGRLAPGNENSAPKKSSGMRFGGSGAGHSSGGRTSEHRTDDSGNSFGAGVDRGPSRRRGGGPRRGRGR
jgi:ATP-dependent RNA helicase RhlE